MENLLAEVKALENKHQQVSILNFLGILKKVKKNVAYNLVSDFLLR
ncbi:hypothetical protein [Ligilactobacillus acidipiscis]|uniref:Uncharacterized protein n=1 Tax=Ligilactobacillus acidipiscis TaxID=89059 RepID=A0A1K1KNM3_9LACO|nr:hypothetical protein [Ligilactobacillus acidipiscis]SFV40498.1 hypothetical protein LAC1533_1078 [Ligilactobacillus acidipiscis]